MRPPRLRLSSLTELPPKRPLPTPSPARSPRSLRERPARRPLPWRTAPARSTRIQRISGPNLARNWVMIPHVTHNDEADITELEAWRKRLNEDHAPDVKVTMVSFLVVACVATLKEFPTFNSSLDGEQLVLKRY